MTGVPKIIDVQAEPLRGPEVPPSINEVFLTRHAIEGQPDAVLDSMVSAVASAREAAARVSDAHVKIMADVTRTEPARMIASRGMATKALKTVAPALDNARKKAAQAVAELESLAPTATRFAPEIRSILLYDETRSERLGKALQEGNDEILAAALCAPPILSGMSAAEHAGLLARWQLKNRRSDYERRGRLEKAQRDLERASVGLVRWIDTMTNSLIIAEAERVAAEAATAETRAKEAT